MRSRKPAMIAAVSSLLLALPAGAAGGLSGADLLLRGTQKTAPAGAGSTPSASTDAVQSISEFKLDDPFSVQLYSAWQAERSQLPPEVSHWVTLQLKQDFEGASHLWSGIEKQLPSSFITTARLTHLRAMIRLGLVQTGMESWMEMLTQASGMWTKPGQPVALASALESSWTQLLGKPIDQALFERGFSAPAELDNALAKLDPKSMPSIATLQAAAALRKGEQGRALLDLLPAKHAYKLPLAQTVALALARKGDLASAAMTLKSHAEPALEAQGNLVKVSSHLLQIARFLFQAGLWEESETYLRKIPNSAPEFISAREELAWVLLRRGDVTNLRGEVASLSTPATRTEFHPELPVVRSISNLKLCSFGAVERDFADFQSTYGAWAKRIEQALASSEVPAPQSKDAFTQASERRAQVLAEESRRLSELHARSLQSSLPSVVGQQAHWMKAGELMATRTEVAKKSVQAEYRRQWKNQKTMLSEAIRKLRFVKIELLHQVRILAATAPAGATTDVVSTSQAAPRAAEGQIVFPLDGVLWPDELFRIQGVVEQRCLKGLTK
jgi:tetratricopeptide (TPR) repeat protein